MYIDEKVFKYPLFDIPSRRDFRQMLEETVKKFPDKESFFEKGGDRKYHGITFKEFQQNVKYFGEALFSLGLKQRDKIGLIGKNSRTWAISYYAITSSNFVVVPIDKELKPHEIKAICDKAKIKAIIFGNKYLETFINIKKNETYLEYLIPFKKVSENEKNLLENNEINFYLSFNELKAKGEKLYKDKINNNETPEYEKVEIDPEKVTSIIFTSGTTGVPKGVMLSQKNIISNIVQMRQLHYIDENDTFLSFLPLHHSYECTCGFLCQVHAGSKIAYADSLKKLGDNIGEVKTTMLLAVPALLEVFYKRIKNAAFSGVKGKILFAVLDFVCIFSEKIFGKNIRRKVFKKLHEKFGGNLKTFISGGSALKPEIAKFFTKLGFVAVQGYGITECSPLLAVNRVDKDRNMIETKFEAVGMPAPGLDIKIFDKNEEGVGEIAVKGPNVMLGYYEEPELTKNAFHNGYFLTGDYGYLDKDNFIHISGRKKDIIITENGKNVYPEEIEFYYMDNKEIAEIVVKEGIDPKNSEKTIVAAIYPDYEYLSEIYQKDEENLKNNPEIFINDIKKIIKENNKKIANFKRIKYLILSNSEFEKTTTKKIKRHKVDVSNNKKYISVY